jgi:hypothetical protein
MFPIRLSIRRELALVALVLACVVGCGGGGGSDSSSAISPPGGNNSAPTIQGSPSRAAVVGQNYSFTPTAADANGDSLTFSIANLPQGASFDTATGRISWTPTAANVASYSNIVITVSDGRANATLPSFTLVVSDVGIGSATISWTPPTLNTDGTAFTDPAGYEIRYGKEPAFLDRSVPVNVGMTTYVIDNLSGGTWYFSVAVRNALGVASMPSELASKVIS